MDRDVNARDNAEHLFRYLRTHRPEINAWFVLRESSADFTRLRSEGHDRVVPYGSLQWLDLCLSARHLLSSHADEYVVRPPALTRWGPLPWSFTFLQHGVTQNDLSAWLNDKPIDRMITATSAERDALVSDGSPYRLTTREVLLTGFPRHDRLLEIAARRRAERPRLLLVMPTWRQSLLGPLHPGSSRRGVIADFKDSGFARSWSALLRSARLARLARDAGLVITFMPHPNLSPYLGDFDLPEHVRVVSFAGADVQVKLASAGMVITDFSSVAFDAALIGRPVVYYQFDREQVYSGAHLTKPGYFSYSQHGFGPVAEDLGGALEAIEAGLATPGRMGSPYAERSGTTFAHRGGSCARVVEAVLHGEPGDGLAGSVG